MFKSTGDNVCKGWGTAHLWGAPHFWGAQHMAASSVPFPCGVVNQNHTLACRGKLSLCIWASNRCCHSGLPKFPAEPVHQLIWICQIKHHKNLPVSGYFTESPDEQEANSFNLEMKWDLNWLSSGDPMAWPCSYSSVWRSVELSSICNLHRSFVPPSHPHAYMDACTHTHQKDRFHW